MDPDETFRAYLLGAADEERMAEIEERLLDGHIAADRLRQVEDELIDDLLFGRLTAEDEALLRARMESSAALSAKLEFARALQLYAVRSVPVVANPTLFVKLRAWSAMPWVLPLAGALGCAALTAVWLGSRTLSLHQELALATIRNDEQKRTIDSMLDEQRRRASVSTQVAEARPVVAAPSAPQAVLRLSPVQRGVGHVAVLSLKRHASTATLMVELPFDPTGTMLEELLNDDKTATVWKQEFAVTGGIADHGVTSVVIPAALVKTGEYYLHVTDGADEATYQFRVLVDQDASDTP